MTLAPPLALTPPPGRLLVLPMPDGQQVVAVVAGEADLATAPRLRDGLIHCLVYRPRSLVIDASDLTFCDLNGLDALSEAVVVAERSGVSVTIRPSAHLTWLIAAVQRFTQTSGQRGRDPSGCPPAGPLLSRPHAGVQA